MSEATSISIITAFYNQGPIFWETYQAIIRQTMTDWEWLIVDDGSNAPESLTILAELAAIGGPRIKILRLPCNQGLPAARNAGVKAALSNYIFFIDSDDLIEPTYLEKAWLLLALNPSFAFANSWSTGFGARNYKWNVGLEKSIAFLDQNWVAFAGLFRKSVLNEIPFNESRRGGLEDWEFWLAAAAKGYWGYTIPERLFHYRIYANSRQKWENWDHGGKQKTVKKELSKKYGPLLNDFFPSPKKSIFQDSLPVLTATGRSGRKLKPLLLVVLPWLSPGGVEQFTLTWMQAMRNTFEYVLVTTLASPDNDREAFDEICQAVFHLAHLADSSLYPALIVYMLTSLKPDLIVLSHAEHFYHLLPFIRAGFSHIPIIDINHIEDLQWQDGGYPKIASSFTDYITSHIVISDWLNRFMLRQGVPAEKVHTVYINTDTNAIRPLPPEEQELKRKQYFSAHPHHALLLFSGRLTHQKNVLLLPKIAAILVRNKILFTMVVVGEGPDREQLEEEIYRRKLTRFFVLTGALEHAEVIRYMQVADLLVLPSEWEGIATVLYEAMAAGIPVVATDVGGQSELVKQECGILFPRGQDTELAAKMAAGIQKLIHTPDLRLALAQAGRIRVASYFDSSITFSRLTEVFKESIDKGRNIPDQKTSDASILENYQDFVCTWNILHLGKPGPSSTNNRWRRHLRRIYKVITGKRPLVYLWKGA